MHNYTSSSRFRAPRNDESKIMIPVTTFAGKTVAVFGLGGSGLASATR